MAGISANGEALIFTEIYSRSIPKSESNITKKSDAISWVEEENEIMSDKRFAIQDFCNIKGAYF